MNALFVSLCALISITVNSDNRQYYASVRYQGGAELTTESFTLFNQCHEVLYTKQNLEVNTFFLSNTGFVFALNEHNLYLFSLDGKEILLRELEYPNGFGFSPDNSVFFASDRQGILAFCSDGKLIYTFEPGRLYASTNNGALVAIVSSDKLSIYVDGILKKIVTLRSPYVRDIHFSDDAKSLIVDIPGGSEMYDMVRGMWVKQK